MNERAGSQAGPARCGLRDLLPPEICRKEEESRVRVE